MITIEELAKIAADLDTNMLENHDPELEKAWEVYESILSSPNSSTTSEDMQMAQVATPGGYSSYDEMDNSSHAQVATPGGYNSYDEIDNSSHAQVATPGGYSSYDEMDINNGYTNDTVSCRSPAYSEISDTQQPPTLTLLTGYQSPPVMTSTPINSPKCLEIKSEPNLCKPPPPSYEEHMELTSINKIKEEMIGDYECKQRDEYNGACGSHSLEYGPYDEWNPHKQGRLKFVLVHIGYNMALVTSGIVYLK